ncbi:hypothetical protein FRC12_005546 [Ceratobasidium sp. 428]|nr:hypothetical protein FRC12_005546 [Ceratobasidium sp. 428]
MRIKAAGAPPTQGHRYVGDLHRSERLLRCYTQNIDGILVRPSLGVQSRVLELHGRNELKCHRCNLPPLGDLDELDRRLVGEGIAWCVRPECAGRGEAHLPEAQRRLRPLSPGLLIPDIVWKEDSRDHSVDRKSFEQLQLKDGKAHLLMVIGTSIATPGAARLVRSLAAKVHEHGGVVVYVNDSAPDGKWTDHIDLHILGKIDPWAAEASTRLLGATPRKTATELRQEIDAIVKQLRSLEADASGGTATDSVDAASPGPTSDPRWTPRSPRIVVICHSGAAQTLSEVFAMAVLRMAKKRGPSCRCYTIVLSGARNLSEQLPDSRGHHVVVVHLSDNIFSIESSSASVGPAKGVQKLLAESVQTMSAFARRASTAGLVMIGGVEELTEEASCRAIQDGFRRQSAFTYMTASFYLAVFRVRCWATFVVDMIGAVSTRDGCAYTEKAMECWMRNTMLYRYSDMIVFGEDESTAVLLASDIQMRPLGKVLPPVEDVCQCSVSSGAAPKAWKVEYECFNPGPISKILAAVSCSNCGTTWRLNTESLVGNVHMLGERSCIAVPFDFSES